MKKTLWIAVICGILAAMLLGVCSVSAQKEVFDHYEKKDYDPHMKPLDLTPVRFYVHLAEGSGPRWTIDKDVPRGQTIEIKATLKQYVPMGRMVFYIMDGQNSFYGFYIRL